MRYAREIVPLIKLKHTLCHACPSARGRAKTCQEGARNPRFPRFKKFRRHGAESCVCGAAIRSGAGQGCGASDKSVLYVGIYVALGFTFHRQLEQFMAFVLKLGVVALLLLVIAFAAYACWALLKHDSKRPRLFGQSALSSQIDDSASAMTTGRPVETLSSAQTTKSSVNT
jgi:hypothetical protein